MRFYNYILFSFLTVLLFTACTNEESNVLTGGSDSDIQKPSFQFTLGVPLTRATDIAFEEGDEIGLYAIKRSGNTVGTMLANGNFCDNKKYIYRSGNFQPATTSDIIYPPSGEKVDFYAYYPYKSSVNPLSLVLTSSANQSIGSNYKSSDYLHAKAEGGYAYVTSPISLTFAHLMGLVEVVIAKNGTDDIISAKVAEVMTEQQGHLQTGALNIANNAKTQVTMFLKDVTPSQYIFRALVPDGSLFSSGKDALYFTMASGMTRKHVSNINLSVQSGKTTRISLDVSDVITYGSWNVSVIANPTTISASGGASTIGTSASRDVFTNGIKTDTETATPTLSASGAGFSLSGITLTAAGNNASDARSCTVTASHGGARNTCTVTQVGAVVTYGSWAVSVSASPTTISASGGTSTISASASRDVYTNGVKTSTETAIPILDAWGYNYYLNGTTLSVGSNDSGSSRSCTVTASQGGVSKTCTVTQAAAAAADVVTYGSWNVSVSASPTTISASGGTSTISANASRDVYTNGVKTSTENATPGLAASGYGFSLSGTTLSAGNNSGSSRSCTVTASLGGVSKTCTVTQAAAADVVTYGSWNVSVSASPTTISASGGTSTISANASRDVYTNGVKTSTENATPTLSASGYGFSLSGTTLSAGNNSGAARSCTVTASHGGVSSSCSVTQGIVNATWQYSLTVTPNSLSFASSGETKSFTVTSKRTKIVNGVSTGIAEDAPYTSAISGANASAFSVSGTSVVAKDNPTADFRDGLLTITQVGTDGKSATITLEQEGKIDIGTEI